MKMREVELSSSGAELTRSIGIANKTHSFLPAQPDLTFWLSSGKPEIKKIT